MNSDPILEAFSKICNESSFIFNTIMYDYPNFLGSPMFEDTPAATAKEFENAIVADPDISKIFPDASSSEKTSYMIYTSCGGGGTVQICTFAQRILQISYRNMLLNNQWWADILLLSTKHLHHERLRDERLWVNHKDTHVIPVLLDSAYHILNVMRNAINGKETKVDVLLYFLGAGIDQEFNHSNGTFIPFHAGVKCIIPARFHPGQYCDVENTGFIYKATVDYKIKIDCSKEDDEYDILQWRKKNYNKRFIKNMSDVMPFACAICSRKDHPVSVRCECSTDIDPFTWGGTSIYGTSIRNILYPEVLDGEDLNRLSQWIEKISDIDDSKIEIAKRRLRSALLEKYNPEDSFIDCIIGLESLFGQRSEIGFTLATCISKLLYDDIACRGDKFDEIKKLYNMRSNIIHNGKIIEYKEMNKYRDQALELLTACLKKLYEDRSGLMKMEIPDRVKKIALQ